MPVTMRMSVTFGLWLCIELLVNLTNPLLQLLSRIKIRLSPKFKEVRIFQAKILVTSRYKKNNVSDADRARKHGMEDFISADPCQFDHHIIFKLLQSLTLDYRLADIYCSLVGA